MNKGPFAVLLAVFAVSCSAPAPEPEPEPEPEPTGFTIRPDDLWLEAPRDVCRRRDADFLERLMDRVLAVLPPEDRVGATLQDFTVADAAPPAAREAILRLRLSDGSLITASGEFDPDTCVVKSMRAGAGPSTISTPEEQKIDVP